jgi:hypothetical protein
MDGGKRSRDAFLGLPSVARNGKIALIFFRFAGALAAASVPIPKFASPHGQEVFTIFLYKEIERLWRNRQP